jgi:hypothetical protein
LWTSKIKELRTTNSSLAASHKVSVFPDFGADWGHTADTYDGMSARFQEKLSGLEHVVGFKGYVVAKAIVLLVFIAQGTGSRIAVEDRDGLREHYTADSLLMVRADFASIRNGLAHGKTVKHDIRL